MYTIRRTNGGTSLSILTHLHDACFGDTAPVPDFRNDLWWLLYASATRPIGFAGLAKVHNPAGWGYLKRTGVMPLHRGRGLQRRLITIRERAARKLGLRGLLTDTTNNPASANNLIRSGYRTYTPQEPWSLKGAIYWRKEL